MTMIKTLLLFMSLYEIRGFNLFPKNFLMPGPLPDSKYCVNCKYFIVNPNFPKDKSRGRCTAFPFEDYMLEPPINPVSGELEGELEYYEKFYACSSARALEQKCGKDGRRFMSKDPTGGDSKSFGT